MLADFEKTYAELEAAKKAFGESLDACIAGLEWVRGREFTLDCYVGHAQKDKESNTFTCPILWRVSTELGKTLPACDAIKLKRVFTCDAGEVFIVGYSFESRSPQALLEFIKARGIEIKRDGFHLALKSLTDW